MLSDLFNLNCAVDKITNSGPPIHDPTVFRIDLSKNEFCMGDCSSIRPIASVDDGNLVLMNDTIPNVLYYHVDINRRDGVINGIFRQGTSELTLWTGHCDLEPFTGFTERKF